MFEAIPMLPAIAIFCLWHPGAYFGAGGRRGGKAVVGVDGIVLENHSDGSNKV